MGHIQQCKLNRLIIVAGRVSGPSFWTTEFSVGCAPPPPLPPPPHTHTALPSRLDGTVMVKATEQRQIVLLSGKIHDFFRNAENEYNFNIVWHWVVCKNSYSFFSPSPSFFFNSKKGFLFVFKIRTCYVIVGQITGTNTMHNSLIWNE